MNSVKNKMMLKIPKYGRNVQQMVDHVLTIKDKETRTDAAFTIINIMKYMTKPNSKDINVYQQKLWNDLMIMADYQLDINNIPYEISKKVTSIEKQDRLAYPNKNITHSHYGSIIKKFIQKIIEMKPGEKADALISLTANHMKRTLILRNKKEISNQVIFNDLKKLSNGKIKINDNINLMDFKPPIQNYKRHKGKKSNRQSHY